MGYQRLRTPHQSLTLKTMELKEIEKLLKQAKVPFAWQLEIIIAVEAYGDRRHNKALTQAAEVTKGDSTLHGLLREHITSLKIETNQ